jgi:two-component system, sensor histidine kinase
MNNRELREERFLRAQLDRLYSQGGHTAISAAAIIALFASFQWERQPASRLLPWLVAQSMPVLVSAVSGPVYRRRPGKARKWLRFYLANLVFLSAAWGAGTILFFNPDDTVGSSLSLVFSAGVTAGALLGVSCHAQAFVLFTLCALTPSITLCLSAGASLFTTFGYGLLAFVFFCLSASRNLYQSFRKSNELRFDNEDLVEKLGREKERAERALAQKSHVLAAASHDLRQPLHALGMFVELLDERLKGEEERRFLARIRAASLALTGLLNALLDISRLDSRTVVVRAEHFRLDALFEQMAAEHAELARRKGLAFVVSGGDLVVRTDRELLARMTRNLLANAVRFTDNGQVLLQARLASSERIELAVSDTGPGIAESERSKIFEEFYQVGNLERDREKGLGLGLAIVRGLSSLLDHPVVVRSWPERQVGSEFTIELPVGDAQLAEVVVADSAPASQGLAGRRVLIIDDERDIRDALSGLLESWDCKPVSAGSLEDALRAREDGLEIPDIVLCDYRLRGGMTGATLLAELEARWGVALTSVIVTGDTSPERIREAQEAGRPILFKPVVPGKLRALLRALVSVDRSTSQQAD